MEKVKEKRTFKVIKKDCEVEIKGQRVPARKGMVLVKGMSFLAVLSQDSFAEKYSELPGNDGVWGFCEERIQA